MPRKDLVIFCLYFGKRTKLISLLVKNMRQITTLSPLSARVNLVTEKSKPHRIINNEERKKHVITH